MRSISGRVCAVSAVLVVLAGCDSLSVGLGAQSTCEEFNAASSQEQQVIVQALVQAAEGGTRNPFREANAVMQITYVCEKSANASTVLSDIAI